MGFFSHRVKRGDLKQGDHIYTWRKGMIYGHHGIYVGDGHVIHYTVNNSMYNCSSSSSSSSSSSDGGSRVEMISLDGFLGNGVLHRFQYGVFNANIRGGTCSTAESDPPEEVIHRATYLLEKGFGNYHLLTNNCEMFALYCKTGLVCTSGLAYGQAGSAVGIFVSAASGLLLVGLGYARCRALLTSFSPRYCSDLGVLARNGGAHRMEVEEYCKRFHGDSPPPTSTHQRSFFLPITRIHIEGCKSSLTIVSAIFTCIVPFLEATLLSRQA